MNNLEPTLTPYGPSNSVVDTLFSNPSNEDFMPSFIVQLNCHNSRATTPEHQPTDLKDKHRTVTYVRKSIASQDISLLGDNSTATGVDQLRSWLEASNDRCVASIIGMDSNLHHQSWNPLGYSHIHKDAKFLISCCGSQGFKLASEKDSPTFLSSQGSRTTIDLTWANFCASQLILQTTTSSDNHGSNDQKLIMTLRHYPSEPYFGVTAPRSTDLDQEKLRKTVKTSLHQLSAISPQLDLDEVEKRLTMSVLFHVAGPREMDKGQSWQSKKMVEQGYTQSTH
ncbi:hypothetical protein PGTUg99_005610 [Puccinia graminis f. sp. tritici]|uniref:Endonuclease/exonuclease/phosphatase domain-containing protein n=1 Tax=Puccinia graminis f. sp. tritici TaxID=56615 RepID=A0A5B0QLM5_PUCGR|nr:hypothetical protein PGTUg99_005610 [Puccinia graminis f. sp. tritici]